MKSDNIPWEAISAYLKDSSDQVNKAIVKDWLKAAPENITLFDELLNVQKMTSKNVEFYMPDEEELWKQLKTRISVPSASLRIVPRQLLQYVAVAAAIVLAFLIGNYFPISQQDNLSTNYYTQVISPPGQRTQLILPDSTKVWLNSNSTIKYPAAFTNETRDVFIQGEGYFEVSKDKERPFIVNTSKIKIRVFGTHFNIKENQEKATVALLEGKVQVLNQKNESLSFLDPGEKLEVNEDEILLKKIKNTNALVAWTNGILVFDEEPFENVINYLENWYGVQIKLDNKLYNKHQYTFKVKTESLREVLDLISVITPINYKINGDQVLIERK